MYTAAAWAARRKRTAFALGLRALHRREAVQDHAGSGGSGGDFCRAGSGRRRIRRRSDDLHAGAAAHLRSSRHHAGRRRSAERHRTHGQVVGGRAHRRRARHGLHGEGHCFGHAAGHHDDARGNHGLGSRIARIDFRRQSRGRRGGAGDARRDRERASAGKLGQRGRIT